MDAVEFCKELSRLCSNHECSKCPIRMSQNFNCTIKSKGDNAESVVEIVEQWAKEHPIRTRQSEFLRMFPDAIRDGTGLVSICPKKVCTTYQNAKYCVEKRCGICRQEFWLTEVTDND